MITHQVLRSLTVDYPFVSPSSRIYQHQKIRGGAGAEHSKKNIGISSFNLKPTRALPQDQSSNTNGNTSPDSEDADQRAFEIAAEKFGRRFVIGTLAASGVALGGNLGGITSFLLGLNASLAETLKLDVVYPVKGFKRCVENDLEFIYPATWVGDQRLLYRAAETAEKQRLYGSAGNAKIKRSIVEPSVAFGPPGSSGELNVSVIVAPVPLDFRVQKLGEPKEAGVFLLKALTASQNSTVYPSLINAEKAEHNLNVESLLYYTLEFSVKGDSFLRHNVSVYVAYNGKLFSMNAQTPEAKWEAVKNQFYEMANSFRVRA